MAATTAAAQRNLMVAAIAGLTPALLSSDRFLVAEQLEDFDLWAETNPAAAFRRFAIRFEAADQPLVSNTDVELRRVTFAVLVAYPHDYRYGSDNQRSMDDLMESDQHQIEGVIGLRAFTGYPDATWVEPSSTGILRGDSCDFLVFTVTLEFWRAFA